MLIAVYKSHFSHVVSMAVSSIEQIFIKISWGIKSYVFGAVYISPGSDSCIYENHCACVSDIVSWYTDSVCVLLGDYNIPHVSWHNTYNYSNVCMLQCITEGRFTMTAQANIVLEYFNILHLFQHNYIGNNLGQILNLIFSNIENIVVSCASEVYLNVDVYHPVLTFSMPHPVKSVPPSARKEYRNLNGADYVAINDYLGSIDWVSSMRFMFIDEAVNFLYSHLNYAISRLTCSQDHVSALVQ